ncbi:MAG: hypothetical protein QXG02_03425 [Candidatus Anstonellales archaeon]
MRAIKLAFVLGILVLIGAAYAFVGCASDAYKQACYNCHFDENGKIDEACLEKYKQEGIACTSKAYPIMSAKYAAGQCPDVQVCASELQSCIHRHSTGNDKLDCEGIEVFGCYYDADICTRKAAEKCGETIYACPAFILAFLFISAGLVKYRKI